MTVEQDLLTRLLPLIGKDEKYLFGVRNCKVLKDCCMTLYQFHPTLESLPIEEKKELWEYVRSKVKGTKDELIEVTKIVYVISKYL